MMTRIQHWRYGQLSKHVRRRMAKYKVANSGSIQHIPGEIEEKWETKRSVKTFTLMSKAPMGDSHSQPFTTTCAISSSLKEHRSWRKTRCEGDPSISCCKMRICTILVEVSCNNSTPVKVCMHIRIHLL